MVILAGDRIDSNLPDHPDGNHVGKAQDDVSRLLDGPHGLANLEGTGRIFQPGLSAADDEPCVPEGSCQRMDTIFQQAVNSYTGPGPDLEGRPKIGRASCRERV